MWERLQRYRELERPARSLFLRAAAMLPLISLSLRTRGFRKTQASLERFLTQANKAEKAFERDLAALTARMVRAAVRHGVGHPTCLEESLALWWLLGRQAIRSEVRIGICKGGEKFEAHAWVEREGVPLNEPGDQHRHYAAFDAALASLPPER